MGTYKAVCFDLFDTLIKFDRNKYDQLRYDKIKSLGLDNKEFAEFWDASAKDALKGVFQHSTDRYQHVLSQMSAKENARNLLPLLLENEIQSIREATKMIPGIQDLLKKVLSRKRQLAIVSNASCIGPLIIETLGWKNYFDEYVYSFIEKLYKPDPQIFLLACDRLGQLPENVVFVSDGARGELSGASAAGLDTIRFDPTNSYQNQYLPPGCFSCDCTEILEKRLLL